LNLKQIRDTAQKRNIKLKRNNPALGDLFAAHWANVGIPLMTAMLPLGLKTFFITIQIESENASGYFFKVLGGICESMILAHF
jgi:hypothetical protein